MEDVDISQLLTMISCSAFTVKQSVPAYPSGAKIILIHTHSHCNLHQMASLTIVQHPLIFIRLQCGPSDLPKDTTHSLQSLLIKEGIDCEVAITLSAFQNQCLTVDDGREHGHALEVGVAHRLVQDQASDTVEGGKLEVLLLAGLKKNTVFKDTD